MMFSWEIITDQGEEEVQTRKQCAFTFFFLNLFIKLKVFVAALSSFQNPAKSVLPVPVVLIASETFFLVSL